VNDALAEWVNDVNGGTIESVYVKHNKEMKSLKMMTNELRNKAAAEATKEAEGEAEGDAAGEAEGEAEGEADGDAAGEAEGDAAGEAVCYELFTTDAETQAF